MQSMQSIRSSVFCWLMFSVFLAEFLAIRPMWRFDLECCRVTFVCSCDFEGLEEKLVDQSIQDSCLVSHCSGNFLCELTCDMRWVLLHGFKSVCLLHSFNLGLLMLLQNFHGPHTWARWTLTLFQRLGEGGDITQKIEKVMTKSCRTSNTKMSGCLDLFGSL